MPGNKSSGQYGERFAAEYLEKQGYKILTTNFVCKLGEIDIIARDHDVLVFIEVKTRRSNRYGYPQEAVTPAKIAKIKKVGEYYMKINNYKKRARIDVCAVQIVNNKDINIQIIPAD